MAKGHQYLSKPRDLLAPVIQPKNPLADIADLKRQIPAIMSFVKQYESASAATVDGNMGTFTAGQIIMAADGSGGFPGDGFTGLYLTADQFEWPVASGQYWNLMGFNNDTLEVGISAITGQLLAGGGAVIVDSTGIVLAQGALTSNPNTIRWIDPSDGTRLGAIVTSLVGVSPNRYGTLGIYGFDETPAHGKGNVYIGVNGSKIFGANINTADITRPIQLTQSGAPAAPAGGIIVLYSPTNTYELHQISTLGQEGTLLHGVNLAQQLANWTTATVVAGGTVKGGSLGLNGQIRTRAVLDFFNNSGANKTFTAVYNFGSFTFTKAVTLGSSATAHYQIALDVLSWNDGATGTQVHFISLGDAGGGHSPGTGYALGITTTQNSSAVDTTADFDVNITLACSAANASAIGRVVGEQDGPDYGA